MSEWPTRKLGEIFEISRGGSPRPIQDFLTDDPGGINWIMISDATDSGKYIERTAKRIKPEGARRSRFVSAGDFLLTNSMSFGRPYIMRTDGCIHDGWLHLKKREQNVDDNYFYHLLGSDVVYAKFKRLAAGATVKNLNIDLVSSVDVPLPPLPEQQRIASILDKADSLCGKRQEANHLANEFLQATFFQSFGDADTNHHAWPLVRLEEVALQVTDGEHQTPQRSSEGVYLLSARNVQNGFLALQDVDYVPQEEFERIRGRCEPTRGDILISCSGSIGRVAQVATDDPLALVRSVALVRPNTERIRSSFLEHFLRSSPMQRRMVAASKSSAQANLFQGPIRALPVMLPPIEDQVRFERIVERISSLSEKSASAANELTRLAKSLRSNLLHSGLVQ